MKHNVPSAKRCQSDLRVFLSKIHSKNTITAGEYELGIDISSGRQSDRLFEILSGHAAKAKKGLTRRERQLPPIGEFPIETSAAFLRLLKVVYAAIHFDPPSFELKRRRERCVLASKMFVALGEVEAGLSELMHESDDAVMYTPEIQEELNRVSKTILEASLQDVELAEGFGDVTPPVTSRDRAIAESVASSALSDPQRILRALNDGLARWVPKLPRSLKNATSKKIPRWRKSAVSMRYVITSGVSTVGLCMSLRWQFLASNGQIWA